MENKTELLERLIKEGKITFAEALLLNKTEKEIVAQPYPVYPQPIQPINPWNPIPAPPFWWNNPITVSQGNSTNTVAPEWKFNGSVTLTDNNYKA